EETSKDVKEEENLVIKEKEEEMKPKIIRRKSKPTESKPEIIKEQLETTKPTFEKVEKELPDETKEPLKLQEKAGITLKKPKAKIPTVEEQTEIQSQEIEAKPIDIKTEIKKRPSVSKEEEASEQMIV